MGAAAEALQFFSTAEGYVDHNSGNYSYVYQYKDHLGNVRLAYKDSNNDGAATAAEILSEDNYYPFGLKHKGYNGTVVNSNNKYKMVGKELQDELGLNVTAMDYRQYDMAIGRFLNPDRLAELAFEYTPYRYAYNNPIFFKDSSGLYEVDKDGNINITNTDEIKKFMSYVQNNKGSSTSDMIGYVRNADNGFAEDLPEVFVTNRNESGKGSYQDAIVKLTKIKHLVQENLIQEKEIFPF